MGGLVETPSSRRALTKLWSGYAETAKKYDLPFLATTPTRRTNQDRIRKSAFRDRIIHSNTACLKEIKENFSGEMYIGALVGCFGDAYTGEGCLNRTDALAFHSWEVELFAKEDIDFFMAGLMPNAEETLGLAQAISHVEIPYIISFTIRRDGCLPDGTKLNDAIEYIDNNVYLPFLIPLAIAQFALAITALIHVLRHPRYRFGNKVMWVLVVLFIQFIGPALYFALGRGEE